MRVFVDADGCPVVEETIELCRKFGYRCTLVADTAHHMIREGAETVIVTKGADAVDFKLVNMIAPGDLVVTQDYGLASMVLARRGCAVNQNGRFYTDENMLALLSERHEAARQRRSGKHPKGPSKRSPEQDQAFVSSLTAFFISLSES
ncbi:MAG: DUF188 domain-containing protein [Clostridia bacterium]|nr:DUF188 domain-containing protein [Clostridia bacterium]